MPKIMNVNGTEIILPDLNLHTEVSVAFSHLTPVGLVIKDTDSDFGTVVTPISDGVYLYYFYDHTSPPPLQVDDYTLFITKPQVVGLELSSFSPVQKALFELAALVDRTTNEHITSSWQIITFDEFPELNPDVEGWTSRKLSDSVTLWSKGGDQDMFRPERMLLVRNGEWPTLWFEPKPI